MITWGVVGKGGLDTFYKCIPGRSPKIEMQPKLGGLGQLINTEKLKIIGNKYKIIKIALIGGPKKYPVLAKCTYHGI